MAGKNQVTLTFAGDSENLQKTFDKVGAGSKKMSKDATESANKVGVGARNTAKAFKGLGGSVGGVIGSIGGFQAIMQGDILGGLLQLDSGLGKTAMGLSKLALTVGKWLAQWVADMASAVASQAAAVASTVAGWVVMGVQAMLNAAKMAVAWLISLGPIGLVIAAVAAVIAILVALGVNFDDLKRWAKAAWDFILGAVKAVFNWIKGNWPLILAIITGPIGIAVLVITRHWQSIKDGFTAVKKWIGDRISDIVGFFTGLPGRIAKAASGMWDGITNAFKSAINAIINIWNGLKFPSFTTPSVTVFGKTFGGVTIGGWDLPNIPKMHGGGTVPGTPGSEMLAVLQAGERVTPAGRAGGVTVVVNVAGSIRSDRDLVQVIRDAVRDRSLVLT